MIFLIIMQHIVCKNKSATPLQSPIILHFKTNKPAILNFNNLLMKH